MIEEFDREIDFLLRQTARGEAVSAGKAPDSRFQIPDSEHLDADEIAAFAENALPEKTHRNYTLHLADCEHCRNFLSNLIALNTELQSEIVYAEEPAATAISNAVAPKTLWYQKIFAVPKLAYAMGALILLLMGVGVFTVLQKDSRNTAVSQTSEKQMGGGQGTSSNGDAPMQETASRAMSNAAMNGTAATNTEAKSTVSPNAAAANLPNSVIAANSNAAIPREASRTASEPERLAKPLGVLNQSNETATADSAASGAPPAPPKAENKFQIDGQEQDAEAAPAQSQNVQNQTQITPDTRNARRPPIPAAKMRSRQDSSLEDSQDDKEKSAETMSVTMSVGGKIFKRAANVWVDAAYRGQPTTNISRGTNEYKKLDSGLRVIVENLGGTVIIVWKNKAYRIQ